MAPRTRFRAASAVATVAAAALALTTHASAGGTQPVLFEPSRPPVRLVDTRAGRDTVDGQQAGIGPIEGGDVLRVPVSGRAGLGAGTFATLNVTVVDAREPGHLTVVGCDGDPSAVSNLNFVRGTTRAALTFAPLDDSGATCIYVHGTTDVVVDAGGTIPSEDVDGAPMRARLVDTREGRATVDGAQSGIGPLPAGAATQLPVAGRGGLAAEGGPVIVTLTAVDPAAAGWARVHACGHPGHGASTVNFAAGEVAANTTLVQPDANDNICVTPSTETHAIVDVSGRLTSAAAPLLPEPRRLLDTRPGEATYDGQQQGIGRRYAGSATALPVAGRAGIPADAGAAILNVVAVSPAGPGHVSVYPSGSEWSGTSTLNYGKGDVVANAVVAPLGPDGAVCLRTHAAAHLVVDVVGWMAGAAPQGEGGCGAPAPLFPARRIVAMYGNDASAALGVLGEQPPDAAADRLAQIAAPFEAGDRPVDGAFELIATIATSAPGESGLYRAPSSDAHVQRHLDVAVERGLHLILDIQPGQADFLPELQRYDRFLRHPNVHAALDPEWHVGPGQVPGEVVGQVDATEVNEVADYLAGIVADEGLPEKMLVVHQFQDRMLTNRELLREPPGVALTIHMDGFGTQQQKLNTYSVVEASPPFSNGFKLFYDEDVDMFEPWEVLALDPVPDLITYQ